MEITNKIKEIAANYFKIPAALINVEERFIGGMSNFTYLVTINDKKYVVRKISKKGLPIVNPKTELDHINLVASLNINSKLIYLDIINGNKISYYIEGNPLVHNFKSDDLELVADLLKQLHNSGLTGHDYGLEERLNHYESLTTTHLSNKYYSLKEFWFNYYNAHFANDKKVLCHGDAQRSNIVKSPNGKLYLLDWEFAGLNNPYYDIASFGNVNFDDSILLLEKYLNRKPSQDEINKLRFFRMYQVLQWHIVALYKEEQGLSEELHLDFAKISNNYLLFAEVLYNNIKGD